MLGINSDNNNKEMRNIVNLKKSNIREVWKENFMEEIKKIQETIEEGYCKVISFDTEFPGLSWKPGKQNMDSVQEYETIKENVNKQNLIQLGMTMSDEEGNFKEEGGSWQFNLEWKESEEHYDPVAIQLLQKSGIDFQQLATRGIDKVELATQLLGLDIFLNNDITWVCFHGNYDFAYLVKTLMNEHLPATLEEFENYLQLYFP